ncbi:hypothetical protein VIGAN_04143200, partial [Vigna angularis var. angularis]
PPSPPSSIFLPNPFPHHNLLLLGFVFVFSCLASCSSSLAWLSVKVERRGICGLSEVEVLWRAPALIDLRSRLRY